MQASTAGQDGIATPPGQGGLLARLIGGQTAPALAASLFQQLAAVTGGPIRLGGAVLAIRHADVSEVLSRDLDFRIAPVNAARIDEVNGPFVLGMDRCPRLSVERNALYRALSRVDLSPLRAAAAAAASDRIAAGGTLDVVDGYARPIAANTARALFGIEGTSPAMFMDVARAVFEHTFLNTGGDKTIEGRALRASALMRAWFEAEIARRRTVGDFGCDMMGMLLADGALDDDGVRRTLGGMLVGSIDTTASAVAKIVSVIGQDRAFAASIAADVDSEARMAGWCWEALRRWPHNPIVMRRAAADTTLAGTQVRAGDTVVAWTQAAMMDPAVFPEPSLSRPDRPTQGYLHFGGGLHPCAGRVVNTWQIPSLVAALVRHGPFRLGRMRWAGPFPAHLDLTFTQRSGA